MPKAIERKLMAEATARGLRGERRNAYVYGTLRRIEAARASRAGSNPSRRGRHHPKKGREGRRRRTR